MIKTIHSNRGGLIRTVIIFIAILIVLAYFGLNLRSIVASQTFQDNWNYIAGIGTQIWNNFLSPIIGFLLKLIGQARNGQ